MFDISFSELMIIGVVALIVIGPERLPKVARTVGHLLGRAQKYVNEVKSDIQNEMDMEEIGNIKKQMEDAAKSVKTSMSDSVNEIKSAVNEPTESLKDSLAEAKSALSIDTDKKASTQAEPAATAESETQETSKS